MKTYYPETIFALDGSGHSGSFGPTQETSCPTAKDSSPGTLASQTPQGETLSLPTATNLLTPVACSKV